MGETWKSKYVSMKELYTSAKSAMLSQMGGATEFKLSSPVFNDGYALNRKFAKCGGQNVFPRLQWSSPPSGTKSFAIIVEDPDAIKAVGKLWVHFVAWNIPTSFNGLNSGNLKKITIGKNSANTNQYEGPCPPEGTGEHHYIFKLYALDKTLDLNRDATRDNLLKAIKGSIVGETQITGLFEYIKN